MDQLMSLCADCLKGTPAKVGRLAFDDAYWGPAATYADVPERTRQEFYADYLASMCDLESYKAQTTEVS